ACQACHGAAGQGDRGPALNTRTLARGDDSEIFHTIRAGLPGTQMPAFARLTDSETWQLVAYIRSIQGLEGAPSATTSATDGDAAAGEALFYGSRGCATCHEVNGRGGITGPDLSAAGRQSAAALRQKIVDPNTPLPPAPGVGRGAAPPSTVIVKTADGREIRGVRRNEDTFSLQMVDAAGGLHLLDKTKVSVIVEPKALMPADGVTRLSPTAITNLVAYL